MKKLFQILILILFPLINYSQTKDSLNQSNDTLKHKHINLIFFISGGINATQYYSDGFLHYLYNKTNSGSSPNIFIINYSKPNLCPIISMGLELSSRKLKKIKLNHIIEASYMRFSGEYFGSNFYEYGSYPTIVHDT